MKGCCPRPLDDGGLTDNIYSTKSIFDVKFLKDVFSVSIIIIENYSSATLIMLFITQLSSSFTTSFINLSWHFSVITTISAVLLSDTHFCIILARLMFLFAHIVPIFAITPIALGAVIEM